MRNLGTYRWSDITRIGFIAALYTVFSTVILKFFSANHLIAIFWPPSGIALAALLLGGKKLWPGVLLGAFFGNLLSGSSTEISLAIAIGNTFEALAGSWLLISYSPFNSNLAQARDYLWLTPVASACALLNAVVGVTSLQFAGIIDQSNVALQVFKWWQGDVLGMILVTPLILIWRDLPRGWLERNRILETLAFLSLAFIFGLVIFLGWFNHIFSSSPKGYVMFVFIVWGALRFGRHGTVLIIVVIATQALIGAVLRVGFFGSDIDATQLNNFWFYMLVLTLVGITLCLTMYERSKAENRILQLTKLYQALSETNQAIIRMEHEADLFPLVCRCAVEYGGMKMAWIGQLDEASAQIKPVSSFGRGTEYLDELHLSFLSKVPEGSGPTGITLRENRAIIINDYLSNALTQFWHTKAIIFGWGSAASFPIPRNGKPFAVFNVYHEQANVFDQEIENLLKEMASDISFALDNFDRETQRQLAEKMLFKSENHFRLVTESAQTLIWMTDTDKSCIWFNKIWLNFTGRTLKQEQGIGWQESIHPQDIQQRIHQFDRSFECRTPFSSEYRIKRHDGEYRWIMDNGTPYFDDLGNFQGYIGSCLDTTERKLAEFALAESESLLSTILNNVGAAIYVKNTEGHYLFANQHALNNVGLKLSDVLGLGDDRFFDAVSANRIRENDSQVLVGGHSIACEESLTSKSGITADYWAVKLPLRQKEGNIYGLCGISTDITERKRLEKSLREKEHLLSESQRAAKIGSWQFEFTSGKSTWSEETYRIFGVNPDNFGNSLEALLDAIYPDDRDTLQQWIYSERYQDYPIGLEFRSHLINGDFKWLFASGVLEKDWNAKPYRIIGTIQDITQRKKRDQQLQLQSKALEAAANAIMITDQHGTIEWINPAFTSMTGYSPDESIGNTTDQLFHCNTRHPHVHQSVWNTISSGKTWQGEIIYPRKDGSLYTEEQVITPVLDDQGEIRHYIAIKQDITERKQNETELQHYRDHLEHLVAERTHELAESRQEAERLTQIKSVFLANMSHEIRSPMNAVLGLCYLLEQRPLEDESRFLVRKILNSGKLLLAIINDILDFSKIEAGRLDIEQSPFSLAEVLDQLASIMSSLVGAKDLELIINPPPLTIDLLVGDSLRLQQVLINLISNAIKFTDRGEVELSISIESRDTHSVQLHFAVRDTGIGIPLADQADIFSSFTQADTSISRRFGGSGLGLSISQQLVNLMGGLLQVTSSPGQGSVFSFVLSLKPQEHSELLPTQRSTLNLLVADACLTTRDAIVNTATSLGWSATAVDSTEALIAKFTRNLVNNPYYDVLLIESELLGLDALETAKVIQQSLQQPENQRQDKPIVIRVTGHKGKNLASPTGNLWADATLSKPISSIALFNTVMAIQNQRTPEQKSAEYALQSPQLKRIRGIRILAVDDSEINRDVAQYVLESEGAIVTIAMDGQDAIDWLFAHPNTVDLILMDIQMPGMDGYAATRVIRQDVRFQKLPIVALTAAAFSVNEVNIRESGMDEFATKPFNIDQLIALIQRLTGCPSETHKTYTPDPITIQTDLGSTTTPLSSEPQAEELPVIDITDGLRRWRSERNFHRFLKQFVDSYAFAGDEVVAFLHEGNFSAAANLVHKLKGVAGNLALPKVQIQATKSEELFNIAAEASDAAIELQHAIDQACDAIAHLTTIDSQPKTLD